jgi:two-component system sensor histidine kinase DegS
MNAPAEPYADPSTAAERARPVHRADVGSSLHLPVTYKSILRDFLAHRDEVILQQAYEFGRAAMNAGLGVFDVIRLHHQALVDGVLPRDVEAAHFASALESFLLEVLSPFEAAHRGFRRALERMQQLNEALAERNAQLQKEITHRERTEAELRESKDHYQSLFQQARAMEESLRDLSGQVLTAQEEERKRISRDLHDEIGQTLTVNVTVAMLKKHAAGDAAFAQKVSEAEKLLAQSMEVVHRFARELRPAMLDHLGVHSALRAYLTNFTRQTGIKVELIPHPVLAQINGQRGEAIFRVTQEALCNVFKHAQATKVKIAFTATAEVMRMEISDNGRAFSVEEKLDCHKGIGRLGLLGMQERLRLVGGTFAITSKPGRGTKLSVKLPLNGEPKTPPMVQHKDTRFSALPLTLNPQNS